MTQKQDMIFAEGMNIYTPTEKQKQYFFGRASFNVNKFIAFLEAHKDAKGWVNVKFPISSKTGEPYCVLDVFEPTKKKEVVEDDGMTSRGYNDEEPIRPEDIPF